MRRAFPGYGNDFLPSLVHAVYKIVGTQPCQADQRRSRTGGDDGGEHFARHGDGVNDECDHENDGAFEEERLYEACKERLLWVATPEVMCQLTKRGTGAGKLAGHGGVRGAHAGGWGKSPVWQNDGSPTATAVREVDCATGERDRMSAAGSR